MANLKVFFGKTTINGNQVEILVATSSKKKMCEIVGATMSEVNNFFSITGNEKDIAMANEKPNTIVIKETGDSNEY